MLRAFHYDPEKGHLDTGDNLAFFEKRPTGEKHFLWLDLEAATEDEFRILDERFGLDPFVIEECIDVNARPMLQRFRDYIFLILHAPDMSKVEEGVRTHELNVVLMKNVMITVHPETIRSIRSTMEAVRKEPASTLGKGPDFVLYTILEALGENYVAVLDRLDDRIQAMEDLLFREHNGMEFLESVHPLRKDILYLRRLMVPQRETIYQLVRGDIGLLPENSQRNFRMLYDHWVKLNDLLPAYRDSIASLMDAYTNLMTSRTNRIMQLLTGVTVILMPLNLIVGFYGMNVSNFPSLDKPGFEGPAIAAVMTFIAGALYLLFRRKRLM